MLIHFTAQDLLLSRFLARPAPLIELTVAIMALRRRSDDLFGHWRRRTRKVLPLEAGPLLDLVQAERIPEFVDVVDSSLDDGVDRVLSRAGIRGDLLGRSIRSAFRAILAPDWPRVENAFRQDIAYRHRLALTEGMNTAITSLLPAARCRVLVYPARTPLPLTVDHAGGNGMSLAALLGQTRAAVLAEITAVSSINTTDLARRLLISPSRASEHATVLRGAGLITSHRHRNNVVHGPTPLGLDLVSATAP